jgi:hypothetical protein
MRGTRRIGAALAALAAMGGCATTSPSVPAGTEGPGRVQSLRISTHEWALRQAGFPGQLARYERHEVRDAQCTIVNDQGTWTVATPGEFQVPLPGSPLKITCRKEGYRESGVELRCMTAGEQGAIEGMLFGLRIFGGALPAAGVVLGVMAGSTALGAAVGSASADAGACKYAIGGEIEVRLHAGR